jgi:hypothetical protein
MNKFCKILLRITSQGEEKMVVVMVVPELSFWRKIQSVAKKE